MFDRVRQFHRPMRRAASCRTPLGCAGLLACAVLFAPLTAHATLTDPITDFAPVHIAGTAHSSDGYSWDDAYELGLVNDQIIITEQIRLVGDDPGATLRNTWETGIELVWSDRFDIVDDQGFVYPLIVDVSFVTTGGDQIVNVHAGTGRNDMSNWYTSKPGGWPDSRQGDLAAHEFGHMLGLYDEYDGGSLDPNATPNIFANSIMSDLGPAQSRHFMTILEIMQTHTDRQLTMAASPLPPVNLSPLPDFGPTEGHPGAASLPEPAALALLGTGLAVLSATRRRWVSV